MKKMLATICLIGALAVLGLWVAHGTHLATLDKTLVETQVTDDFGDTVTEKKWVPAFKLGLDYAGPSAGFLLLSATLFFWGARRENGGSEASET